jgi:hypothetical protein
LHKEYALKIVIGKDNVELLKREYSRNHEISADCVVRGCDFIRCDALRGAGMLMEEVGTKVDPGTVLAKSHTIFDAMVRLHLTGYAHGDARVANLINCKGIFKWCDVERSFRTFTALDLRNDITELLKSLRVDTTTINNSLFFNYATSPSMSTFLAIVNAPGCSVASDTARH